MTEPEIIELFEERAAMREYEGGERRELAEMRAAIEVRKVVAPDVLPRRLVEMLKIPQREMFK